MVLEQKSGKPDWIKIYWKNMRALRNASYLYVAPSGEKGHGLFAARRFDAGEIILFDEELDGSDLNTLAVNEVRNSGFSIELLTQISVDQFVVPTGGLDEFINHSCDPNSGMKIYDNRFEFVALRDIDLNDEVTFDYSTHWFGGNRKMTCNCGLKSCRKLIGDINTLEPQLVRRYRSLGMTVDVLR